MKKRLGNEHGAAMLLAIYFSALALLLLNSASLQRSLVEVRAAERAAETQRSFWLAESALDQALLDVRSSPTGLIENRPSCPTPFGQASYTVTNVAAQLQDDSTVLLTREIVASGQDGAGKAVQVAASYTAPAQVYGMHTSGRIEVNLRPQSDTGGQLVPVTLTGDVMSDAPRSNTIWLDRMATINGDVITPLEDPRRAVYGDGEVLGNFIQEDMQAMPPAVLPPACAGQPLEPLVLGPGRHIINDGDAGVDRSGPGDQLIVICASDVQIQADADVQFQKPTMIFVQGGGFSNRGDMRSAASGAFDRGLTVAVAPDPAHPTSAGNVEVGSLRGSVYAPLSQVGLYVSPADGLMSHQEVSDLEQELDALRHTDITRLPKPDDWNSMTYMQRDHWYQLQRNDIQNQIDRLLRQLNGQAVSPDRQLGYLVAGRINISGVDVKLRSTPHRALQPDMGDTHYLDWEAVGVN